jgi:hypothetical protein
MRLEPFERVDGRAFSVTRADLVASLGSPQRESQNALGLYELDYGTVVYRFQLSGRLEEVTAEAPVLHVDNVSVPFAGPAHASVTGACFGRGAAAKADSSGISTPRIPSAYMTTDPALGFDVGIPGSRTTFARSSKH